MISVKQFVLTPSISSSMVPWRSPRMTHELLSDCSPFTECFDHLSTLQLAMDQLPDEDCGWTLGDPKLGSGEDTAYCRDVENVESVCLG